MESQNTYISFDNDDDEKPRQTFITTEELIDDDTTTAEESQPENMTFQDFLTLFGRLLKCSSNSSNSVAENCESQKDKRLSFQSTVAQAADKLISKEVMVMLANVFEAATQYGRDSLTQDEFKLVMKGLLKNRISEEALDILYVKHDPNCVGAVKWDEYITFNMLELQLKDTMEVQDKRPFQDFATKIKCPTGTHTDSIIAILHNQAKELYYTVDKSGAVAVWTESLEVKQSFKMKMKGKYMFLTAACLLENDNVLALADCTQQISFYDVDLGAFYEMSYMPGLEDCPSCMYYWYSPVNIEKSLFLVGDRRGGINIMVFNAAFSQTKLCNKEFAAVLSTPGSREFTVKVNFTSLLTGQIPHVTAVYLAGVHRGVVSQIHYLPYLTAFVSCGKEETVSLCLGKFSWTLKSKLEPRKISVEKGVTTLDYCGRGNVLVTGGFDKVIRIWNPFDMEKPSSIIYGHSSPINVIKIHYKEDFILSLSFNREIRIHDLHNHVCLQQVKKHTMPDFGPKLVTGYFLNMKRQEFIMGTDKMILLQGRQKDWAHPDTMSQLTPVVKVLYNPLYNYVISAGWDGYISVWNFISGKMLIKFKTYKTKDVSLATPCITAMEFGSNYRWIITSNNKGILRIWNFNNGEMLKEFPNIENVEISTIACHKNYIMTGGWSQRVMVIREAEFGYDLKISLLNPPHKDDIMSLAVYKDNVIASGSYNGEVYIWHQETGYLLFCLNTTVSPNRPLYLDQDVPPDPKCYFEEDLKKDFKMLKSLRALPPYLRDPKDKPVVSFRKSFPALIHAYDPKTKKYRKMRSRRESVPKNRMAHSKSSGASGKIENSSKTRPGSFFKTEVIDPETLVNDIYSMNNNNNFYMDDPWQKRKRIYDYNSIYNRRKSCLEDFETKRSVRRKSRRLSTYRDPDSPSIEHMLFLDDRELTPTNGTLAMARDDGSVVLWAVHANGGLQGTFQASYEKNEPITALAYAKDNNLLITGDLRGYIRVWDINHYCNDSIKSCSAECQTNWEHFTFVKFKRRLYQMGKYHNIFPYLKDDTPHLINSFRGHTHSISSLAYSPNVRDQELIISSSLDCSIRLWSLNGEFLGCYGQTVVWNLKELAMPIWRDGNYTTFLPNENNSLVRVYGDTKSMMPPDVQKVGSATTLTVLRAGKRSLWTRVKEIITILFGMEAIPEHEIDLLVWSKLNKRKKKSDKDGTFFTEADYYSEHALKQETPTKEKEGDKDEQQLSALNVAKKPYKTIEELRREFEVDMQMCNKTSVLGDNYKTQVHPRTFPIIDLPEGVDFLCPVYGTIDYVRLEDVRNPFEIPVVKNIFDHALFPRRMEEERKRKRKRSKFLIKHMSTLKPMQFTRTATITGIQPVPSATPALPQIKTRDAVLRKSILKTPILEESVKCEESFSKLKKKVTVLPPIACEK